MKYPAGFIRPKTKALLVKEHMDSHEVIMREDLLRLGMRNADLAVYRYAVTTNTPIVRESYGKWVKVPHEVDFEPLRCMPYERALVSADDRRKRVTPREKLDAYFMDWNRFREKNLGRMKYQYDRWRGEMRDIIGEYERRK